MAVWSNLQPPATAAMAWALFHEALPAGFLLSAVLVLGGVWIAQTPGRERTPRGPEAEGASGV